jgi:hypothetical protein
VGVLIVAGRTPADAVGPEVARRVTELIGPQSNHRSGGLQAPMHARLVQALMRHLLARCFHHPAADLIAGRQKAPIAHPFGVAPEGALRLLPAGPRFQMGRRQHLDRRLNRRYPVLQERLLLERHPGRGSLLLRSL